MFQASFGALATDKDYEDTAEFFKVCPDTNESGSFLDNSCQDRDTSLYGLALEQALDNIKTKSAWIKVCATSL